MRAAPLLILGAGVFAYLAMRPQTAEASYNYAPAYTGYDPALTLTTTPTDDYTMTDPAANLRAVLNMIQAAEGVAYGYATLYGNTPWGGDFSDHPANQGWHGVKLSDTMCRNAGLRPGCVSTAAGAYQIIKPTWNGLRSRISLPSFEPAYQDAAAVELIREAGALPDIEAGALFSAVQKIAPIWASLPGNRAKQGQRSPEFLAQAYVSNGGVIGA